VSEGIELIKGAGGRTALAHIGYYVREFSLNVRDYLKRLTALGLEGVEAYYPYSIRDPRLFTQADQQALQDEVLEAARELKLDLTRGSDCHFPGDFDTAYASDARW
jgi:predicted metal-dependent phosphoesterase TrpH